MMKQHYTIRLFLAAASLCLLHSGALNAEPVKAMDVAGVTLGMDPDQAAEIAEINFSLHQLKVWMENEYGQSWHRETQAFPPRRQATQMPDATGFLHLYFTNPPMDPAVLTLWRKVNYPMVATAAQFNTKPPTVEDVIAALHKKYGTPDVSDESDRGVKNLVWQDGEICAPFQKPAKLSALNVDPKRIGKMTEFKDCSQTLFVQVAGSRQIKNDDSLFATVVKFYLFDFPTLYVNQSQYDEIVQQYKQETARKLEENQMEPSF